jgi:hypothetical protein
MRVAPVAHQPLSLETLGTQELDTDALTLESFQPSMPLLTPPSGSSVNPTCESYTATILSVLTTLEMLHEVGRKIHLTQSELFKTGQNKLAELQKKELEKMEEAAKKTQTSSTWEFLQTIGAYILAAIHTVLGGFLISQSHVLVGGTMIASGLIAVSNLALTHNGFWTWLADYMAKENKELATQLSAIMPALVGIAAASLGFIGTYQIWNMADQINWAVGAILIANAVVNFAEGVSSLGKGISDYDLSLTRVEQLMLEGEIMKSEFATEKLMKDMERMMKTLTQSTTHAARIVKMFIEANQRTLQV